jgi:phage terminase large subunit-like protein
MFTEYYSTRLWSEPKKSGKTFIGACLLLWWAYSTGYTEIIVAANDQEQAQSRVFKTATALIRLNPTLAGSAQILANEIRLTNGTIITAIASEFRGAAGARQSLVIYDELWGYSTENLRRLFEELTVNPTEREGWTLITTYAGFFNESELLEGIYKRGLKGKKLSRKLPVYAADRLFMFWSHERRQPWQLGAEGKKYYAEQRRTLRENTYRRLHDNAWVSAESSFVSAEQWAAIEDRDLTPMLPNKINALILGVDIGVKNDNAAVVAVCREGEKIRVAFHRVWRPKILDPVQLADVQEFIEQVCRDYLVSKVAFDPSQAFSMMQALQNSGVPVVEFPQTTKNTTAMATEFFNIITAKNLRAYPDKTLRQHVLNATAIEMPSGGLRMAKSTGSKKIDIAAALAIAVVHALQTTVLDTGGIRLFGRRLITRDDADGGHPIDVLLDRAGINSRYDW